MCSWADDESMPASIVIFVPPPGPLNYCTSDGKTFGLKVNSVESVGLETHLNVEDQEIQRPRFLALYISS